jgi:spore coat polysaccharide biosynthesis protein SpsF
MKTALIVQARMGSSRLPGKVMLRVLGKTLIEYQVERLSRCSEVDELIIATTVQDLDDPIADLCKKLGVHVYRGSVEDVLSRYYEAAKISQANLVVRCNSDCPLIDHRVVDGVIRHFKEGFPAYDYASNILMPTYPTGMHTEVFTFQALKKAFNASVSPEEREHVTPFVYRNPKMFNLSNVKIDQDLSKIRLTIDYQEDYEVIKKVIEGLYPKNHDFNMWDIINFLNNNPEISKVNSHFEKKATI